MGGHSTAWDEHQVDQFLVGKKLKALKIFKLVITVCISKPSSENLRTKTCDLYNDWKAANPKGMKLCSYV